MRSSAERRRSERCGPTCRSTSCGCRPALAARPAPPPESRGAWPRAAPGARRPTRRRVRRESPRTARPACRRRADAGPPHPAVRADGLAAAPGAPRCPSSRREGRSRSAWRRSAVPPQPTDRAGRLRARAAGAPARQPLARARGRVRGRRRRWLLIFLREPRWALLPALGPVLAPLGCARAAPARHSGHWARARPTCAAAVAGVALAAARRGLGARVAPFDAGTAPSALGVNGSDDAGAVAGDARERRGRGAAPPRRSGRARRRGAGSRCRTPSPRRRRPTFAAAALPFVACSWVPRRRRRCRSSRAAWLTRGLAASVRPSDSRIEAVGGRSRPPHASCDHRTEAGVPLRGRLRPRVPHERAAVELARKLHKEMDDHKTVSVSRVYVPNEYTISSPRTTASSSPTSRTRCATSCGVPGGARAAGGLRSCSTRG